MTLQREIATIAIYPPQGRHHAEAQDLSALAGYTRSLLHALPKAERQRHVVLTNKKNSALSTYKDHDIEIREMWSKGSALYAWQIFRALQKSKSIRLVHLQHEFNQFGGAATVPLIPLLLAAIRFILRRKVVVTLHEVLGNEMLTPELVKKFCLPLPSKPARVVFRLYYRLVSSIADTVLVQHQHFADRLRKEIGVRGAIRILPIGTETDVEIIERNASRQRFGYSSRDKILLFFGTIDWRKGLDILLDAFERLEDPDYRLLIGGGQPVRIRHRPEYKAWYEELESRMAANPQIQHIGFVADEDIPALFGAADLVVLPYVVPQMVSAVLNQAASYDCAFIGSNAFMGHADPEILFDAEPGALVEKIHWAFENLKQIEGCSAAYKNRMSWPNSAALLSEYYTDTLNQNRTS